MGRRSEIALGLVVAMPWLALTGYTVLELASILRSPADAPAALGEEPFTYSVATPSSSGGGLHVALMFGSNGTGLGPDDVACPSRRERALVAFDGGWRSLSPDPIELRVSCPGMDKYGGEFRLKATTWTLPEHNVPLPECGPGYYALLWDDLDLNPAPCLNFMLERPW